MKGRRNSLTELSASPILSSKDKLIQVTPELIVRKRGRSFSGEEIEEPTAKISKMDDLKAQLAQVIGSLGEIKGETLVKEDLSIVKDRLAGVEEGQTD